MKSTGLTTKIETARERQMRMGVVDKLRVNVKSLAAESRAIRYQEHQAASDARYLRKLDPESEAVFVAAMRTNSLQQHRTGVVRRESRLAQLALAFVRGTPYRTVEQKTETPVDPGEILNKIKRVGSLYDLGCLSDAVCFKQVRAWLGVGE